MKKFSLYNLFPGELTMVAQRILNFKGLSLSCTFKIGIGILLCHLYLELYNAIQVFVIVWNNPIVFLLAIKASKEGYFPE